MDMLNDFFTVRMRYFIIAMFMLNISSDSCFGITNYGSRQVLHRQQWGGAFPGPEPHAASYERGPRHSRPSPPSPPWEEALRHSVYLTLVRDKIDDLLRGQREPPADEDDVNLWREIKRAPFVSNGRDRGPIFGDIAVLSRGRLTDDRERGLRFVEDDRIEECIECRLYGAEKSENLQRTALEEVRALWTVRRIRHRTREGSSEPFRFELTFSVSSARPDGNALDYNSPTQTFTISETDRHAEQQRDIKFLERPKKEPDYGRNAYTENGERGGRSYWVHKNVDVVRHQAPPERNVIEGYRPAEEQTINTEHAARPGRPRQRPWLAVPPVSEASLGGPIDDHIHLRGHSKFGNYNGGEEFSVENVRISKSKGGKPTVTHLHHHYYLNDKGIPVLKSPEFHNVAFEMYLPKMYNGEIVTAPGESPHVAASSEPDAGAQEDTKPVTEIYYAQEDSSRPRPTASAVPVPVIGYPPEVYAVVEEVKIRKNNSGTYRNTAVPFPVQDRRPAHSVQTPHRQDHKKTERQRITVPTKPFRPSPVDFQMKYSEEDPLLPPTLSTPVSYTTGAQSYFTDYKRPILDEDFERIELPTRIIEIEERPSEDTASSTIAGNVYRAKTNVSEKYENSIEHYEEAKPTAETTTVDVETTQIVYPERNETVQRNRKKAIRPLKSNRIAYKPNRRVKLQKKFSDLVSAQVPAPSEVPVTPEQPTPESATVLYVTDSINSDTKHIQEVPKNNTRNIAGIINKNESGSSYRKARLSNQRKASNWALKRPRTKSTTTASPATTVLPTASSTDFGGSELNIYVPIDNLTESMIYDNVTDSYVAETETQENNVTSVQEDILQAVTDKEDDTQNENLEILVHSSAENKNITGIFTTEKEQPTTLINSDTTNLESFTETENPVTRVSEIKETTVEVTTPSTRKTTSHKQREYAPRTKKSYVTSISLKLGNKTRPYFPRATPSSRFVPVINRQPQWIENNTFMEGLLKQFDFDDITKAKISEVGKTESVGKFNVYRAVENGSEKNPQSHSDEMDDSDITHQIINHANSIKPASANSSSS